MKMIDDVIIIGIDSGYGNIKTANCCFPASLSAYDREPVFKENLLVYESKFYLIGEGHKEFLADKTRDLDYYVLALAAIARELNIRKMTCGKIRIVAGLPLTWVSGQRDEFRDYLMQNKAVDFSFRKCFLPCGDCGRGCISPGLCGGGRPAFGLSGRKHDLRYWKRYDEHHVHQ